MMEVGLIPLLPYRTFEGIMLHPYGSVISLYARKAFRAGSPYCNRLTVLRVNLPPARLS